MENQVPVNVDSDVLWTVAALTVAFAVVGSHQIVKALRGTAIRDDRKQIRLRVMEGALLALFLPVAVAAVWVFGMYALGVCSLVGLLFWGWLKAESDDEDRPRRRFR